MTRLPLLLVVPHCSGHVPLDILTDMLGPQSHDAHARRQREQHIFLQGDPYTDELYTVPAAHHCFALVSRFVVDLNRARTDGGLNGVIKLTDFDGTPLYPEGFRLSHSDWERRLQRYWDPFHRTIAETLRRERIRLLVDVHSMVPCGPAIGPDEGRARPAFNLATLGTPSGEAGAVSEWTTVPAKTAQRLADLLSDHMRSICAEYPSLTAVTLNDPFAGGGTLRTYCHPAFPDRVPGFGIEINRALYLDGEGRPKREAIRTINHAMRAFFEDALRLVS